MDVQHPNTYLTCGDFCQKSGRRVFCLHQDIGAINPPFSKPLCQGRCRRSFQWLFFPFYHCNSKGIGLLGNLWELLTHAAGLFVKGGRVMGREVGFQSVGFRTDAPIQTHS